MDKYTIELNAARKDSDYIQNRELNAKSPVVEVFSAMVEGKTLPNLGVFNGLFADTSQNLVNDAVDFHAHGVCFKSLD